MDTRTLPEKLADDYYTSKLPFVPHSKDPGAYDARLQDQERLRQEFRADLAREEGVTGNPKEPLLFRLAWERGHSAGWTEVAINYEEMVELVRP